MFSKSEIVSPVYFPFTFISPSLVETMSLFFHRMCLYQPVCSKPQTALRPWMDKGFLNIRVPFENLINKKSIEAMLRNYKNWGLLHQHADLAYLKTVGDQIAPDGPVTARIISEIRGLTGKTSKESENRDLALQIFLHLAQDFDQQSLELRQQLNQLNDQYQALQSFFRQNETEQGHHVIPSELFPFIEDDPWNFLIEKRMAAWNHLFQKDPAESTILFTDSPAALVWLLDTVKEKVEVLKFDIAYAQAPTDQPPRTDHLEKLFDGLLRTPWGEQLQESIKQTSRHTKAMLDQWKKSTPGPYEKIASFRWYLVPNQGACRFLNRRCAGNNGGEEKGDVKNTVVGLVTHGPQSWSHSPKGKNSC
ncbi:MAG: hypothetical protein JRJ42_02440 [Deltaproteobacteria bacterium]|nr:hypothetical protein [Deltaproteobacteria bacterium]